MKNLTLDKFIGEEKFEQATVAVDADRVTLKMNGDGQLFGAATHLDAERAPGDDGSATLNLTLDQAARAKHKMNLAWLTGPVPVKIKAPLSRTSADVELDLTPAAIDNPVPGVAKPAGKPGRATFQAKPAADGATLGAIAIDFGTVSMRGSADAGPDGSITAARIAQARISPGDDFKVDVVNSGGLVKATVHGSTLDARPFMKSLAELGSPTQANAKDIDIDMKLADVVGANRQSISGFELNASRRAGDDRLTLRGRIGQGVLGATLPAGGDLRLVTTDAGALAKFADLYPRMEGGSLDLSLRTGGDASAGTATITNFALRDEPAFRQLVAAAPAKAPGVVDPTLVRFQRMTVNFEKMPGVLEIKDAIIYNPYMGLTTAGRVNFSRNTIDVGGTFVPAYSVNTILTKIPLVGLLLGGGQDEGVFGLNYRVQGPISAPQVSVNPLSAIAPGILRKMLGVIDGSGGHDIPPGAAVIAPRAVR